MLTSMGLAAKHTGLARGDGEIAVAGLVEGGGVSSTFLFIDDDAFVTVLMEAQDLPLYWQIWASSWVIVSLSREALSSASCHCHHSSPN